MSIKQTSRIILTKEELDKLSKEDLINKWQLQESYLKYLESKNASPPLESCDPAKVRDLEEKLQQQKAESTRRENILVQRLSTKIHEKEECFAQLQYLKQSLSPPSHLKSLLVDPAVKLLFDKMQSELEEKKTELAELQNEMSAWKFTPDSNTGKRLMLKCRKLHQENEELGKLVTSGRVAKLESELALQKNFSQEIKQSQAEMDDVLVQMEENAELMQNTIQALQNRLKESKKELEEQKAENARLKEQVSSLQEQLANQCKEENGGQVNHRTPQTPPPPVKEEDEKPPSPPSANDELQKLPSKVRTRHKTSPSVEGNGDSTSPPPTAKNCLKWSSANSNGGTTPAKKTPKIKRTSSRNPTVTTAIKKANCDPARTNDGSSPKRFKKEDEVSPTEVQVAKTLANWANGEVEH